MLTPCNPPPYAQFNTPIAVDPTFASWYNGELGLGNVTHRFEVKFDPVSRTLLDYALSGVLGDLTLVEFGGGGVVYPSPLNPRCGFIPRTVSQEIYNYLIGTIPSCLAIYWNPVCVFNVKYAALITVSNFNVVLCPGPQAYFDPPPDLSLLNQTSIGYELMSGAQLAYQALKLHPISIILQAIMP